MASDSRISDSPETGQPQGKGDADGTRQPKNEKAEATGQSRPENPRADAAKPAAKDRKELASKKTGNGGKKSGAKKSGNGKPGNGKPGNGKTSGSPAPVAAAKAKGASADPAGGAGGKAPEMVPPDQADDAEESREPLLGGHNRFSLFNAVPSWLISTPPGARIRLQSA